MLSKKFRSNKFYQVTRYTFKYGNEWDEMESTVTVWDTYEKAMAYIERYSSGLKFASAQIEMNNLDREITYEDYKKGDYNIVSFQKIYDVTLDGTEDTEPEEIIYMADEEVEQAQKKDEKRYIFYVDDYTEKRESPVLYVGYTKKEITGMVQEWANKNNHVYKIFIANKTSDKALAGRVFFKVINWKQTYKVGKTGSRLRFGEFLYEEAEKYCKEYAEKDGIAYTIYEVKLDEYGRDDTVQVINIEPPEKIVYYGVRGYSHTFDTLDEAQTFAKNQRSKSELIIYKAIEIDNGLRTTLKQVDVIPAYSVKQHTHYELEINEYDETGYITNENTVKFKTLEEATAYVDKLIKNAGENEIVLRLYKVTGEDFECLFTKRASRIHGIVGILEDKPGQTVAETPAEYTADNISDSELISMLVKEPVNANLYDFMREPERIKISKNGKKKLRAIREIVKRALVAIPEEKQLINTPNDAANLMMKRLRYETKEKFYIIILNTKNKVVNISRISEGSLSGSIVHPANVFKEVLKYETASSIILCHNHPSGEPVPSMEDINITLRLIKAGRLLDVEVLDHIVIGDGIFKSMKQEGIIRDSNNLSWQATACESR